MNIFKNNSRAVFFITCLWVVGHSCKKFLHTDPPLSTIPVEELFADDEVANLALAGIYLDIYSPAKGFASGDATISVASLSGLSADELHYNTILQPVQEIRDFEGNNLRDDNAAVGALWQSLYTTIYETNAVLENLEASSGVTLATKNRLKGEALFLRAFSHFYLVNIFGDVPVIVTTDYNVNSKVVRVTQEKVYAQVERDLLEARDLLPEAYPNNTKRIRPIKYTAIAFLARLYLFKKDWSNAEESASQIINRSDVFKLEPSLNNVFLSRSTEAIWQIKPPDGTASTNEGASFGPDRGPRNNVLTQSLVQSFSETDKRRLNWINAVGELYLPHKYKVYLPTGGSSTEYSMVFRLAEQYFIRAEARARLGNYSGSNSAESDINSIRSRAGLQDTTVVGIESAIGIIEHERRLELFTEWGHRWFDLKRWDRATAVLGLLKPGWTADDMLYPLPSEEMSRNPFLKPQNPNY